MLRTMYLAIFLVTITFAFLSCVKEPPEYESYPAESIHGVVALPEGGFILAGVRSSSGSGGAWAASVPPIKYDNLYVLRVDDAGEILWEHDVLISDSAEPLDYIVGQIERMVAAITPNGEIAIAGGGYGGVFIARTDPTGTLFSAHQHHDIPSFSPALTPTSDGGFLIAGIVGNRNDTVIVLRTDASDQEMFRRSYRIGNAWDDVYDLQIVDVNEEGFFLVMQSHCIKFSTNGDSLWTVTIPLSGLRGLAAAVAEPDGGFTVAGTSSDVSWFHNMELLRFNATGECLWLEEYDLESGQQAQALVKTNAGGYALLGQMLTPDTNSQFCLLQTDANGVMTAFHSYNVGSGAYPYSLCNVQDGGHILGGQMNADQNINAVILRTTSQGNKLWNKIFGL